ncbi:MAG: OmpA family protein [Gemmatimonadota bacterium]|jgi:outer membrane protein OmpA-like peptidoglycan-associated protein
MKKSIRMPGRAVTLAALAAMLVSTTSACASLNRKEKGAAIGAAAGAAVGGIIGNQTGSTARGAIIGAVVGGAAGAIIGHQMDQQAKELKVAIPGAEVTRVGEGMVVTFPSGLLYDFDSSAIRPDAAQNLKVLAQSLEKYSNEDLLIVGHTDAVGSEQYNQQLSLRRADAAAQYLEGQGVAASRIRTTGKGETEPIASNETAEGRQLNRRIEVAIYASQAARDGGDR